MSETVPSDKAQIIRDAGLLMFEVFRLLIDTTIESNPSESASARISVIENEGPSVEYYSRAATVHLNSEALSSSTFATTTSEIKRLFPGVIKKLRKHYYQRSNDMANIHYFPASSVIVDEKQERGISVVKSGNLTKYRVSKSAIANDLPNHLKVEGSVAVKMEPQDYAAIISKR